MHMIIFYVYGDCSSCVAKISDFQDYVHLNDFLLKDVLYAMILVTENIYREGDREMWNLLAFICY